MTLSTWLLFMMTELALSLAPGPAVFYAVSQSIRGSVRRALPAAAGTVSGNALYFALSATSLGALIAASAKFFAIMKWAGAGYLIYLGIKSLMAARSGGRVELTDIRPERGREGGRIFVGAFTLQLANPKALLFFLALLPQFIDPARAIAPQMIVMAASSIVPEFCILVGYGWLANRAARVSAHFEVSGNMNRWFAVVEGLGLLGCAALVLNFDRAK